jgi:hypothetical protein
MPRHIGDELRDIRQRMLTLEERCAVQSSSEAVVFHDLALALRQLSEILLTYRASGDVADNYVNDPPLPPPTRK